MVGTEVLRDPQPFRFERLEPFREAITGAIEEMPGLLVQRLKKGGTDVDSPTRLENTMEFGRDLMRFAVMLERVHDDDGVKTLIVERQSMRITDHVSVPEDCVLYLDDMIEFFS